jgi:hypothetical protein
VRLATSLNGMSPQYVAISLRLDKYLRLKLALEPVHPRERAISFILSTVEIFNTYFSPA